MAVSYPFRREKPVNSKVMKKAEKYIGKEYKHRGEKNSFDCFSLVVGFLGEFGIILPEDDGRKINKNWYDKEPDRLISGLKKYGKMIRADKLQPLDVVVFSFDNTPRHMGVMVSRTKMLHARDGKKSAIIRLKHYKRFLHSCWRLGGGEINE